MSKIALIALTGETDNWVVDFDAGTVTPTAEAYCAKAKADARASGVTLTKGIDVAIVAELSASPASFQYFST